MRVTVFILFAVVICFSSLSSAASKYDLQSIVGDQILTSNLLLRGMFLDEIEIKLGNDGMLGFHIDIEKRKIPFGHPRDDYSFDILINDKKVGRTSSWFEWEIDDEEGIRVQHDFSDDELAVLFTLAPLSGKKIKLSNDHIIITGDLRKSK